MSAALLNERRDEYGTSVFPAQTQPGDEAALTALVQGQDYIDIVFADTKTTTTYLFDLLQVEYPGPGDPPAEIFATTVVKSLAGFRAWLNGKPPDGNYRLNWRIRI